MTQKITKYLVGALLLGALIYEGGRLKSTETLIVQNIKHEVSVNYTRNKTWEVNHQYLIYTKDGVYVSPKFLKAEPEQFTHIKKGDTIKCEVKGYNFQSLEIYPTIINPQKTFKK